MSLAETSVLHVLHPGDVVCADRDDQLDTLLGSCVAIILTDPRRSIAAMCHLVHSSPCGVQAPDNGAYAEVALGMMFRLLRQRGINPTLCDAYVYGGGNMFPTQPAQADVGAKNAQWALCALAEAGIRVVDQQLGDNVYRRVRWAVGPEWPQVRAVQV
jgi:chemotaxis protein CheD